jgi:hypothetical protein
VAKAIQPSDPRSETSDGLASYTEADDGKAETKFGTERRSRREREDGPDVPDALLFRPRLRKRCDADQGLPSEACCGRHRPVKRKKARQPESFVTEDKGRAIAPFLFVPPYFLRSFGPPSTQGVPKSHTKLHCRTKNFEKRISTFPKFPHQKSPRV